MNLDRPGSLELDILNFLYNNAKTTELLVEMLNYEDECTFPGEEYATEDAVHDCLVGLYSRGLVHGSWGLFADSSVTRPMVYWWEITGRGRVVADLYES